MLKNSLPKDVLFSVLLASAAAAVGMAAWAFRERQAAERMVHQDTAERAHIEQELAALRHQLAEAREESMAEDKRLEHAAEREQRERHFVDVLQRALDFFEQTVFSAGTRTEWTGPPRSNVTLREALDAAEQQIAHECADQPLVEALVRSTFGPGLSGFAGADQGDRATQASARVAREGAGAQ